METIHQRIKIKDVFNGYRDKDWDGVVGYGGKLDIRPIYQREFIYNPENERAVIDTILKEHPLNLMYWVKNGNNFEVLDGQLGRQKQYEEWERDNPPPTPPGETTAELTARLEKAEKVIVRLAEERGFIKLGKSTSTAATHIQRMLGNVGLYADEDSVEVVK